jgi:hypothetical protein
MKITVDIVETLSRGITVDADTVAEALETVERGYKAEEYVLDYKDLCSTDFFIATDCAAKTVTHDKGMNPQSLVLIKDGNEAETRDGRQLQAAHAAYIDGYITATGEISRFIHRLWKIDKRTASTVYHAVKQLSEQQDASYKAMCDRLNDKASWDEDTEP